jgi:hypothetical protein
MLAPQKSGYACRQTPQDLAGRIYHQPIAADIAAL